MDDSDTTRQFDVYLSQFRQHLADTSSDLQGVSDASGSGKLDPSYLPPTGYWTPEQKNQFFHALSIHSRWRPDLIAQELQMQNGGGDGGKSVVDVCAYIDLLDKAAVAQRETDQWQNGEGEEKQRAQALAAMEVSHKWVAFEEEQASLIAQQEPSWDRDALEEKHLAELQAAGTTLEIRESKEANWSKEEILQTLDIDALRKINEMICSYDEEISIPVPSSPQASSPAPADLSPASRRRLQKRLYMRRQRALITGSAPSQETGKLARGRKRKERPMNKQRPSKYRKRGKKTVGVEKETEEDEERNDVESGQWKEDRDEESDKNDGDEEQGEDASNHPHPGGLTRPEKVKKLFAESGIDAAFILGEVKGNDNDNARLGQGKSALSLLNLGAVGKLIGCVGLIESQAIYLKLFYRVSSSAERANSRNTATPQHLAPHESSSTPQAISLPTLYVLSILVVAHTTQLVHAAIIAREAEGRLKEGKRVWRMGRKGEVSLFFSNLASENQEPFYILPVFICFLCLIVYSTFSNTPLCLRRY